MVLMKEIPTGSGVHKLLPNLQHPGKCVNVIPLKDSQLSQIHQVELANFDMQSLVAIKTYSGYTNVSVVADALVNGLIVSNHIFQTNETNSGVIADVSGCRFAGMVYQTNTTVYEPSICSTVTCQASGVATAVSGCASMERCQGNGSCALNAVCTVAGSIVIDFMGGHQPVPDRCGYALLRSPALSGVQVVGVFKERRSKSVSFLERVILQLDGEGVEISMEQGNRVQLDDTLLMLNATAQLVHGVELSKDQTGVTVKITDSNYNLSVLFDGFTAIIHMTGPPGAAMHGLCADSSATLNQERVTKHSTTDCGTQYEDSTTDCHSTTAWCNLLKEGPFAACNSYVDPKPFIDGCTQNLCEHPPEDDFKCQFLEAYAQTCRHYGDVTVEGWRSQTGCSAGFQAICRDKFCSDHEFCGVDSITGETRCLCRAIFASKYKPTNSYGEPIVCEKKSASVTLANCLLKDKGIDYSILTLNDQTCRGEMDNVTHMVTFSSNSENACGTVIMANSSHIIYKNTIMTQNLSTSDMIVRHDNVHMDFSCYYTQPDVKSLAIRLRHSSVIQHISFGEWKYNLTLEAYTNPDRTEPVDSNTDIALNEKLWVELKADGLDENMLAMVTDSCWATNQPLPAGTLRYDLIIDGCPNPNDETVTVEGNGMGMSNHFSFNTFQFSGKNGEVYLHCKVELCVKHEDTCIKSCSQAHRRRRSAAPKYLDKNSAFISVAWTY
ncbi:alpha-tectorin-like [Melanotaenia boesemani]|uniref:alpha-tectorin-like n=1 Tax=Melanotaenia boesemani TaxID=1250792 RepID=UPI001C04BF45|nr:alpha-tectorin-like [Melanotaenia boesemani]